MNDLGAKAQKRIQAWCKRTRYEVGSHLYPHGYFITSLEKTDGGREWRLARWDSKQTRVELVSQPCSLNTQAKSVLSWELAIRGVSPTTKPAMRISGVPFYPRAGV